jgi:hypothetical protein
MALLGEGGVPMRSMSRIGWGFGKISQETWEIFLALKIAFLNLYRIAHSKEAAVADLELSSISNQ